MLIRDPAGKERFARVKVPGSLPRLVPLRRSSGGVRRDGIAPRTHYFVWLEQVIAAHLGSLFPGMEILAAHPFRVIRDADILIQELEAYDLLETIEVCAAVGVSVLWSASVKSPPWLFRSMRELLRELSMDP